MRIQARTSSAGSDCPVCGVRSIRVHSRYERRLADTAAGGQEMFILLQVRRFFCRNDGCATITFAEQVLGPISGYGRRSSGLSETLRAVALALGGRAGGRLACPASRSTLLRLIRALPDPAAGTPKVRSLLVSGAEPACSTVYATRAARPALDSNLARIAASFGRRGGLGVRPGPAASSPPARPCTIRMPADPSDGNHAQSFGEGAGIRATDDPGGISASTVTTTRPANRRSVRQAARRSSPAEARRSGPSGALSRPIMPKVVRLLGA
jgi:hypothetical protein